MQRNMLLSLVSKVVSILLVLVVTVTALALLISQTLLNSQYIEGQLSHTNSYSRLSDALVNEIASTASQPTDPTVVAKLKTVLTPVIIQQKLSLTLEQLQAYYQGSGKVPVINVSDLAAQAQAAGIPLGSDSGLDKPITLTMTSVPKIGQKFSEAKRLGLAAAILLVAILLLVCWRRKRWVAIADVLMSIGVLLGIFAAVFGFGPGIAERFIRFNVASNAFATIGHDLALSITHDLGVRLGFVAASYFIVGLVLRFIWHRHHKPQRPSFLK